MLSRVCADTNSINISESDDDQHTNQKQRTSPSPQPTSNEPEGSTHESERSATFRRMSAAELFRALENQYPPLLIAWGLRPHEKSLHCSPTSWKNSSAFVQWVDIHVVSSLPLIITNGNRCTTLISIVEIKNQVGRSGSSLRMISPLS
jgi:hypothetical protein